MAWNNNNNTVISIVLFTERPGALTRTSDVCSTNSSVLRRRLKRPVLLIWWRWCGRLFHAVGPAWEKPHSPNLVLHFILA